MSLARPRPIAAWHAVHIDSYSPFVSTPFLAAAWIDPTGVTTHFSLGSRGAVIRSRRPAVAADSSTFLVGWT